MLGDNLWISGTEEWDGWSEGTGAMDDGTEKNFKETWINLGKEQ